MSPLAAATLAICWPGGLFLHHDPVVVMLMVGGNLGETPKVLFKPPRVTKFSLAKPLNMMQ
jgi:hypothetical protein